MARHVLKGSERDLLPGAKSLGAADPAERLDVTLILRRNNEKELRQRAGRAGSGDWSQPHLTREAFASQHSASANDIAAVRQFATSHGISVVQEDAARATVVLSGTVAQFNGAFGVKLERHEHGGGTYRGRTGAVYLPDELKDSVTAVLGLDNRPMARPHFRGLLRGGNIDWKRASTGVSYNPTTLASLYKFPQGDGSGTCVGIIELGGGYRPRDLTTYFTSLGLTKTPTVTSVSVDHGSNAPTGDPNGPDGEVMLDIEVIGAVSPGAKIVVYFAPNTDAGFLDAITTAVHDTTNHPSVISISWGSAESEWTAQSTTAFDNAFQDAATMGITVCVAAGDSGSSDGVTDGANHVDFPASSPHALACGGTNLQASNNVITSETVWNDGAHGGATGGGVSVVFALPSWQEGRSATANGVASPLAMRGVPDVSGDADPESGYNVRIDGTNTVIGGTSAVAPLWAGLLARINGASGKGSGLINPALYASSAPCNDIVSGNNGSFSATKGWDACTGLGSPDGTAVATALGAGAKGRQRVA